jgi:hypothetical protein
VVARPQRTSVGRRVQGRLRPGPRIGCPRRGTCPPSAELRARLATPSPAAHHRLPAESVPPAAEGHGLIGWRLATFRDRDVCCVVASILAKCDEVRRPRRRCVDAERVPANGAFHVHGYRRVERVTSPSSAHVAVPRLAMHRQSPPQRRHLDRSSSRVGAALTPLPPARHFHHPHAVAPPSPGHVRRPAGRWQIRGGRAWPRRGMDWPAASPTPARERGRGAARPRSRRSTVRSAIVCAAVASR